MFQYTERPCGCIDATNVADRTGPTTFIARPCAHHLRAEECRDEAMDISQCIALLGCVVVTFIVVVTASCYIQEFLHKS